jgi:hypothetical protein
MAALTLISDELAIDVLLTRQLLYSPQEFRALQISMIGHICPDVKRLDPVGASFNMPLVPMYAETSGPFRWRDSEWKPGIHRPAQSLFAPNTALSGLN